MGRIAQLQMQFTDSQTLGPITPDVIALQQYLVRSLMDGSARGSAMFAQAVEHGERWSRWSFVGRRPAATFISRGSGAPVEVVGGTVPSGIPLDQGILAAVEGVLSVYRSPALPDLPPLHGGLVGYLGYDVVREVERLPDVPDDDQSLPEAVLSIVGELAAFDHWRQRVTLIANAYVFGPDQTADDLDRLYDDAVDRLDQLARDGAAPLDEPFVSPPDPEAPLPDVVSNLGAQAYEQAVDASKEHILSGDIFQVVLSQRFDFQLDADPFDVYRVLRQVNPSPYMYFVRQPGLTLVGSSPEPMVQVLDGTVISRPVAGTRRRGRSDEEDRRLGAELVEHPKERAEHVMLIDLARNDVGRVVEFGTEKVDEMMTLERYSHVMHLTSQVSGRLAEGRSSIDVLRATLPAEECDRMHMTGALQRLIATGALPVHAVAYTGTWGEVDSQDDLSVYESA